MSIKCYKSLKYEISDWDAQILKDICTLAQLIVEGKSDGNFPPYMTVEKREIVRFITTIFEEVATFD